MRRAPFGVRSAGVAGVAPHAEIQQRVKQQFISSGLAVADFIHRYPRRITATLALLMLGSASGAFAVAKLAPAVPAEPIRLVSEDVALAPLTAQLDQLDSHSFTLYHSARTQVADSPASLLERLGIADPQASAFLRRDKVARDALFSRGAAGRVVSAEADDQQNLKQLTVRWLDASDNTRFNRLVVEKAAEGFTAKVDSGALVPAERLASGVVGQDALTVTGDTHLPADVTHQLSDIFSNGPGTKSNVRKGDRFALVYRVWEADGEVLRVGRVLSAELTAGGKTQHAVWFADKGSRGDRGDYYALGGESLYKPRYDLPLGKLRITSGFGLRVHPVAGATRHHEGVDLAAPRGTPVHAVADGRVEFAGVQHGYGNVVYVQHADGRDTTVYGHLSRIDVKMNQRITRGEQIGTVGSTGIATGPHLHFELRVNGSPINPSPVLAEAQTDTAVPGVSRAAFAEQSAAMLGQLAIADQLRPGGFE